MNWISDMFNQTQDKQASKKEAEEQIETVENKKISKDNWAVPLMDVDEAELEQEADQAQAAEEEARGFAKEAAYELDDTQADTIEKDYKLKVTALSDRNLAEMITEYNLKDKHAGVETYNDEIQKTLKSVKSGRSSAETKLLNYLGEHTKTDPKEAFKKFSEWENKDPKDGDVYGSKFEGGKQNWDKKTDFSPPSDESKLEGAEGQEEEKGQVGKEASKKKAAAGAGMILKQFVDDLGDEERTKFNLESLEHGLSYAPGLGMLEQEHWDMLMDIAKKQDVFRFTELVQDLASRPEYQDHSSYEDQMKKRDPIASKKKADISDLEKNDNELEMEISEVDVSPNGEPSLEPTKEKIDDKITKKIDEKIEEKTEEIAEKVEKKVEEHADEMEEKIEQKIEEKVDEAFSEHHDEHHPHDEKKEEVHEEKQEKDIKDLEEKHDNPFEDKKDDAKEKSDKDEKKEDDGVDDKEDDHTEASKNSSVTKLGEYNGWKNYETWNVALWLDNDQGTYDMVREMARNSKDLGQLSQQLKEYVEENTPDLGSTMYADILGAALSDVDWYSVAQHYEEDVQNAEYNKENPPAPDALSSKKDIRKKLSNKEAVKKLAALKKIAAVPSPWAIIKDEEGNEVVAKVGPSKNKKESEEEKELLK